VTVELKTIGIVAITHSLTATIRAAHYLPDKLTVLFELHKDKHIRSHFYQLKPGNGIYFV